MTSLRSVWLRAVLSAVAAVVGATAARADIVLDDFNSPNPAVSYNIGPNPSPTNIVTGNRTITLTTNGNVVAGGLSGFVGEGTFVAAFGPLTSGNVQIAYTFPTAQNFIPNVPAGGAIGDLLIVASGDRGFGASIPLDITLSTANGGLGVSTFLPLSDTLTPISIPLASLTGDGDLAQVTGLTIGISGGRAADIVLNSLVVTTPAVPTDPNVVPAPPAALLALAVLPALGLRRALRRKAA